MPVSPLVNDLRKRREMMNVTQEDLAEIAGIGLRTLKQLESGRGNPTMDTLEKVAAVLGLEVVVRVRTMKP